MSEHVAERQAMTRDDLRALIANVPREQVANLPTPLEPAPRLRRALGSESPSLFIKRDDSTGLALGGNKVRHLEFRLADMRARGADTLTVCNASQSNHARLHTALAARFGLSTCILKVPSHKDDPVNGNFLLDRILGAEIVEASSNDPDTLDWEYRAMIKRLETEGRTVYDTVGDSFSGIAGVLAYMLAATELLDQLDEHRSNVDHIFLVQGASSAGLALAGKLLCAPYRVHPVGIGDQADVTTFVCGIANQTANWLGLEAELSPDDLDVHEGYAGAGYMMPTPECLEAIYLAGRTEALILDPVYTGKAFAGLVDQVRNGNIGSDETVVFVHTGGVPITFAYADEILASLPGA